MLIIAIVPLIVAIIGLLIYVLATNSKVIEVGRCLLWCGVLVTLFVTAHETVKVG